MVAMDPAQHSFAVHLESLLSFAQELTTQMHGISKPSDELEGLLAKPIALGAFNEADSLGATHAAAVEEMRALLADVTEALTFANDVTKTVADGYKKVDENLAAYLTSSGVLSDTTDTSGTTSASATPPLAITGRHDGQPGVEIDVAGVQVTAGTDGLHVHTADPGTGSSSDINVPVDLKPVTDAVGATTNAVGQTVDSLGQTVSGVTQTVGSATQPVAAVVNDLGQVVIPPAQGV